MRIQGRVFLLMLSVLLLGTSASARQVESVPGEFLVKVRPEMSSLSLNQMSALLGGNVREVLPEQNLFLVQRSMLEVQSLSIKSLTSLPQVEIAEPNFIYRAFRTPNDPMLSGLWGIKNVGQKDSSNAVGIPGVDVDVERAWDLTTGSKDFVIAVIDTGTDFNHPDLKENIWSNALEVNGQPGVDDDKNGVVDDLYGANFVSANNPTGASMDDHGHGTHCSGTIGATGNDGKGIVGVAWNARIMGVKFLSASGSGTLEGAVKSIDYATKMGAKIMSNSWGGGGFSQLLKESIERTNAAGVVFVAAAGNDASNNDESPAYPASYDIPNVISVAALNNRGQLASFSNYGRTVHVAAPGVNVLSSVSGGDYDSWSGTSMATPHVSGVVALMISNDPSLTSAQIKQRLITTSKPLSAVRGRVLSGGIVSAFAAMTNQAPPPNPNDPANWQSMALDITTPHPYPANYKGEFEVSVPNAKEIALYFEKFDTERNYDFVKFYNRAGQLLGQMHGANNASFSEVFAGDYVKIVFQADETVQKYGFDLSKVAYR